MDFELSLGALIPLVVIGLPLLLLLASCRKPTPDSGWGYGPDPGENVDA